MEDFKEIFNNDALYAIGSVIAGIYYGFKKFVKKPDDSTSIVKKTETDLINILRTHVNDELKKNEEQQDEIKELKKESDRLEQELDKANAQIRKYDAYHDRIKYFCPFIPDELESFTFSEVGKLETCFIGERRKEEKPVLTERRKKSSASKKPEADDQSG